MSASLKEVGVISMETHYNSIIQLFREFEKGKSITIIQVGFQRNIRKCKQQSFVSLELIPVNKIVLSVFDPQQMKKVQLVARIAV